MSSESRLRPRSYVEGLEPYVPGEQLAGGDIVKLNTNENPYPPAPMVLDEIQHAGERLRMYPDPLSTGLRRAIAAYHAVQPGNVLPGNGSDEVLRLLVQAFVGPGRKVAVVNPSYSLYPVLAAMFEGGVETHDLVDRQALPESLFTSREPLLLLPNPNPPIGTLYERGEIARLCESAPDRLVIIDEAYVDFAPRDAVPLLKEYQNLGITRTFSKSYSLAGMRLGYLLAHERVVEMLMKLKDSYNLNHLSQTAGSAAIASYQRMRENADVIVRTREEAASALREMGYTVPQSHGNFIFAMHPRAGEHFSALRERGVLVRYWDKPGLDDGMRITIGTPEEMRRLYEALRDITT